MKYVCSFCVMLLASTWSSAQSDTITHVLERGESIEYLAEKYSVTEADIRNCNSNFESFYTGMELRIPVTKRSVASTSSSSSYGSIQTSLCEHADALFAEKEYKKAEKAYSAVIKSNPLCTDAYYGRALAYYNRGKWKSAIKDFRTVISSGDCSESVRSQCRDLLAKAQSNREEQLERRSEMWGALFATAAVTTAAVITAKQQSKQHTSSIKHASTSNHSYCSSDSDDEESTSYSSDLSKKSSCSGPRKYNCGNTGICALCNGDGLMNNNLGFGANSEKCTLCGGSGKCKYCN